MLFFVVFGAIAMTASKGYEGTLAALVKDTRRLIQSYMEDDGVHYITTAARQINISKSH